MSLKEIEIFFSKYEYTKKSIQIDQCTKINDVESCVNSLNSYLKNHPGNASFKPYYDLLLKIYKKCNN